MGWTTPKIQTWSFSTVDFVTVFGFWASHMHQWFWVCGSFFFRKINVCQIRCIYFKLPQKPPKSCKFRSTNCLCMSLRLLPHICQLCTPDWKYWLLAYHPHQSWGDHGPKGNFMRHSFFPQAHQPCTKEDINKWNNSSPIEDSNIPSSPEFPTETHSQFSEIIQIKNQ